MSPVSSLMRITRSRLVRVIVLVVFVVRTKTISHGWHRAKTFDRTVFIRNGYYCSELNISTAILLKKSSKKAFNPSNRQIKPVLAGTLPSASLIGANHWHSSASSSRHAYRSSPKRQRIFRGRSKGQINRGNQSRL